MFLVSVPLAWRHYVHGERGCSIDTSASHVIRPPCRGPFTVQLTSWPACPVGAGVDSELVSLCMKECIKIECCRAGDVRDGQCVLSMLPLLEGVLFVKNVEASQEQCLGNVNY